ncbi:YihY/virulence factor BrkB family protein [Paenibacillus sp. sptzw28]|uniref:YihY/virulence factor BrkB family protein n=1 Tax=Paenibacillus sp. sptzw28 TaxID=715179 RepID=UPI001C6ED6DD|nr:YihY/virulence factor BrkB family protein [Paenibacillus sp. sptzw28]QYR22876.1 YihY/virulence factor BrkB family protein [Paenibacillus sp. sptzw28]
MARSTGSNTTKSNVVLLSPKPEAYRPASNSGKRSSKRGRVIDFAQQLYCRFQDDEVPAMGAQLTYYLVLSFFPFLIFIIAVLSFADLTVQDVTDRIHLVLPEMSTKTISDAFRQIQQSRNGSLLSFGLIVTLWSASNGVSAVMKALNKAYDAAETRPFWKIKAYALFFTVVLALVIAFSFIMLIFGRVIGDMLYRWTHLPGNIDIIWGVAQFALPIIVMIVVFSALYLFVPNLRLRFREVVPGALFATFGWIITSICFSFYVNNFGSYTKTYGSIGGIIVLLTWLYLSSIIVVLGGEINATLHFGKHGKQKMNCKQFSLSIPFLRRDKKDTGK